MPTNKDFRNLTDDQLDLILYSLQEDNREMELAQKGLAVDSDYYDSTFEEEIWNKEVGDWEVLKEGHDANSIAKQVEELTREEDRKNLYSKFDSLEEYNKYLEEGGKTSRETEVEEYINKQLRAAKEKAEALEINRKHGLVDDRDTPEVQDKSALNDDIPDFDKKAIEKSIEMFNSDDDDDDDFTEL